MHARFTRWAIGATVAFSLFAGAGMAQASSLTQGQISSIVDLLKSFDVHAEVITNVITALDGEGVVNGMPVSIPTPTPAPAATGSTCVDLGNSSLKLGDTDATTGGRVSRLQTVLNINTQNNGTFGPLTMAAVRYFQLNNNLITSELSTGAGVVGPKTRELIRNLTGCSSGGAVSSLVAPSQTLTRSVVPISQHVGPHGGTTYSIPITIGSQTIEAQIDSGATGVRILPGAIDSSNYTLTNRPVSESYDIGTKFDGLVANAIVTIGGQVSVPMPIQVIQTISCTSDKPNCPASQVNQADFGIAGYGIAGAGFKATVGIGLRPTINNPLANIGNHSWLVILPQSDSNIPGQLIINPSPDETAGYTTFQLSPTSGGWGDNMLNGCVTNNATGRTRCQNTILDLGQIGVSIASPDTTQATFFNAGTNATLTLTNDQSQQVTVPFSAGSFEAAQVSLQPSADAGKINTGFLPFLYYSFLYDSTHGTIGLKPR